MVGVPRTDFSKWTGICQGGKASLWTLVRNRVPAITHMTIPIRTSRTRHVTGRENRGVSRPAPKASEKNQRNEASIAPRGKHSAHRPGVLRGQPADQHHRVEQRVGVEQAEPERRQDCRLEVRGGAPLCVQRGRLESGPEGTCPVADQKRRADPDSDPGRQRRTRDQRTEAARSQRDQPGVTQRTGQRDRQRVLSLQALPQHEGILRADGDDQTQPQAEAPRQRRSRRVDHVRSTT